MRKRLLAVAIVLVGLSASATAYAAAPVTSSTVSCSATASLDPAYGNIGLYDQAVNVTGTVANVKVLDVSRVTLYVDGNFARDVYYYGYFGAGYVQVPDGNVTVTTTRKGLAVTTSPAPYYYSWSSHNSFSVKMNVYLKKAPATPITVVGSCSN